MFPRGLSVVVRREGEGGPWGCLVSQENRVYYREEFPNWFEILDFLPLTSSTACYSYSSYLMESKGGDVQVFREFTVTLVRPPPWVRLLRCAEGVEVP